MTKYNEKDLAFFSDAIAGDFMLGNSDADGTVDFRLTDDYESARQDISIRIRTQTTDWAPFPKIGGDLELLEGEPNTRETAMKGVTQIQNTLTYDGRFQPADVNIRAVPTGIDEISYFVFVDAGEDEPIIVTETSTL